jgi:hypothetical protein
MATSRQTRGKAAAAFAVFALAGPRHGRPGEPLRTTFELAAVRSLTQWRAWNTVSDTGLADWKHELAPHLALTEREAGMQRVERIWIGRRD